MQKNKKKVNLTISHIMQRDTTDLSAQNKELKMKLEAFEQQAQLREGMHHFIFIDASKSQFVFPPHSTYFSL